MFCVFTNAICVRVRAQPSTPVKSYLDQLRKLRVRYFNHFFSASLMGKLRMHVHNLNSVVVLGTRNLQACYLSYSFCWHGVHHLPPSPHNYDWSL